MSRFVLHLDVVAYVEADSWAEAEQKFYSAQPLAHYVEGVDVIYDVSTHAIEEVEAG